MANFAKEQKICVYFTLAGLLCWRLSPEMITVSQLFLPDWKQQLSVEKLKGGASGSEHACYFCLLLFFHWIVHCKFIPQGQNIYYNILSFRAPNFGACPSFFIHFPKIQSKFNGHDPENLER